VKCKAQSKFKQSKLSNKLFPTLENINLVDELHHSNSLWLVRVVLARVRVVIHHDAQPRQQGVDALDVLGVAVHAAGGVGHIDGGLPVDRLGGPVTGVQ
jgi:hypothetical protein